MLVFPLPAAASGSQRGFSLIEVLVALLLVALGVLGATAMQLNTLRLTQDSAHRMHASLLAADLLERMRANRAELDQYAWNIDAGCLRAEPVVATLLAQDRADFAVGVTCNLPAGHAQVRIEGGVAQIRIRWSQRRVEAEVDPGSAGEAELLLAALVGGSS